MDKKLTNDENIENLKKRKILRIIIIIFSFLTIILALLNLFFDLHIIFAGITFIIVFVLNKVRDNTRIIKIDDLEDVRDEIKKTKRKK